MPKPRPPTAEAPKPVKRKRGTYAPGDEMGALDLGKRVAQNLRQKRKARSLSLEDLSQASGVSRAALSQIETCKTNPTVGVLWKIAVGLRVPFADLIGEPKGGPVILRRTDAEVLASADGRFKSRPLTPAGASPLVEVYELTLAARALHEAEPHAPGTHEVLVVLVGSMRVIVGDEAHQLGEGDSIAFSADQKHAYANSGLTEARCHNVIIYDR